VSARGLFERARRLLAGAGSDLSSLLPGSLERRRARASEARLGFALRAAGMAIWELDSSSGAMWWSPEARLILGDETVEGESSRVRLAHVLQRIHPDDRAAFQAAIGDAVTGRGDVRRVQVRIADPTGVDHWIELRGQAWSEADGSRSGLRGTLVDVTEQKRVEAELRRNLDEFRVVAAVAETAAGAADEATLLSRVSEVIRDAFFPDNCGFLILDEPSGLLRHAPGFHHRRPAEELRPVSVGTGIAGAVADSGESRLVNDTQSDPEYVPHEAGMRSEVCVPLKVGSRVLGVLDAESERLHAFSEADERLLQVVASHVANALERLRSGSALRRSRELYRAYFTASPLAVFVADTTGRYLEVNGAATALTGYSQAELLRMSIADLMVTEDVLGMHERLVRLLTLGSGRHEVRIRRKDGEVRHCLVHAATIGASQVLGFLLDITDRREAEERLRESEERFRGLSEASTEAILIHDEGRIVDVNHALCALSGYSWHELVGRDPFDLVAPEDRERVYRMLLMEYDQPYEITGVRRDGSPIPLEVRARSFPFRGQLLRVVALRDISERKRAEATREALILDLEAKNLELERFTHTVSHDLKSPLITMRGFIAHLIKDLEEGRSERLLDDARRVSEAGEKMQFLLDRLVEISQVSRPSGPAMPVPLDDVVAEAVALAEERRSGANARIEVKNGLPLVLGDRGRLVPVFVALVDNAIKFTQGVADPRVTVEAGPVADERVTVVVRDNGIGIEPALHERVFGLFEKLDPGSEGMGVGLTLARRVVESLGGQVWLKARERGEGLEAWVRLPVAKAASKRRPRRARAAAGRPRG